jgi:HSP20 family protein
MTTLMTPFTTFETLWSRLNALAPSTQTGGEGDPMVALRPHVDIFESASEFVIETDLPGVSKDALKVEVEKDRLTIRATREPQAHEHEPIHIERYARATLERTFTLGTDLDASAIKAQLKDGVLRLTLPKAERALPKRIAVE